MPSGMYLQGEPGRSVPSGGDRLGATTKLPQPQAQQPPYLDQPKSGGAAHAKAMIQEKATPMMAWFSPKRKLLMGLQTTTYLSMARTTSDQRAISPAPTRERDGDTGTLSNRRRKSH